MSTDTSADIPENTQPGLPGEIRPDGIDELPSTLAIPVRLGAAVLQRALDDVLESLRTEPALLYQHDALDFGVGLAGVAQVWRRGPTQVSMYDDTVFATLPVRVTLRPAWKPHLGPLPLPVDIPLPLEFSAEYTVRLRATPRLDTDYNVRLDAKYAYTVDRAVEVEAIGFGLGVTFNSAARRAAEEALDVLCNWLNGEDFTHLNFRNVIERGWRALQEPFAIASGHHVRLDIAPRAVHPLPFRVVDGVGELGLAVVANIHAVATSSSTGKPVGALPPITSGPSPDGISLVLPMDVEFASLAQALRERIVDHPLRIEGRHVIVRGVDIRGSGDGELTVRVDLSLSTDGGGFEVTASLSASGRPLVDPATQHVSLDNFRYDAHTDSRLLNFAATLLRPFAGKLLEPWLDMPVSPHVQKLLDEANQRLAAGITLADGIELRGYVAGLRILALEVVEQGLRARLETHGELAIRIDRVA